jgi:hypothetical protein
MVRLTRIEQKENILLWTGNAMPPHSQPHHEEDSELEKAVDQAIAACDGNMRSAVRALIVANNYLESEVSELMKAISHAYTRGRFQSYSG